MSEYIVCTDDLEESYYRCTDIKPETVFGHRLREEIVRCRDCAYNAKLTDGICYRFDHDHFNNPDGFCAWGERQGDAE